MTPDRFDEVEEESRSRYRQEQSDALSRRLAPEGATSYVSDDGHPVEVVRSYFEEGVEFAVVRYLDGFEPGPVGGRVAGTEEDPLWEHRVKDGKVLRSGGNAWNDEDWVVEKGLRRT